MKVSEQEFKKALVDSTLAIIVLATMLKNRGLTEGAEVADKNIADNKAILAKLNVFFTPFEQQEYLDKLNKFRTKS